VIQIVDGGGGFGKVKTSRGLTAAILEAAYGLPMMKIVQLWQG